MTMKNDFNAYDNKRDRKIFLKQREMVIDKIKELNNKLDFSKLV